MTDSILQTVKQMLGLDEDCNDFDTDIIVYINSALFSLYQLGVGPDSPYSIENQDQTWMDFLGDRTKELEAVKPFIFLKTKVSFDPPSNSFVLQSIEKQISELEWRLEIQAERSGQNGSG